MAPIPSSQGDLAKGCVASGYIWAFCNSTPGTIPGAKWQPHRYDSATDAWTTMTIGPVGFNFNVYVDMFVIGTVVHLVNGSAWHITYDTATDSWTTGLAVSPVATDSRACAGMDKDAYCFGGFNSVSLPQQWAYVYHSVSDSWEQIDDVPFALALNGSGRRGGANNQWSACVSERRIHFLQGQDDGVWPIAGDYVDNHFSYDTVQEIYREHTAPNGVSARERGMGCDTGDQFITAGGISSAGTQVDPETQTWKMGSGAFISTSEDHPALGSVRRVYFVAHAGYFWAIGGAGVDGPPDSSLCRWTPDVQLGPNSEGWGIHA
jgi:hypothetical protein